MTISKMKLAVLHWIAVRLGRGGAFMLIAIIALCLYQLCVQIPRIAALEHERQAVAAALRNLPPAAVADAGNDKKKSTMPGKQEILEQKFIILAVLKEHRLIVENVAYKSESLVQEKLEKTVMDITLVGRYSDFSEALEVLYKMGGIQVDMAAFERSKIASPVVNMRLQLALLGAEYA